jgi:predicted dehydrogenase
MDRVRLGVIGAGRIGAAYARMMVEGHKTAFEIVQLARAALRSSIS